MDLRVQLEISSWKPRSYRLTDELEKKLFRLIHSSNFAYYIYDPNKRRYKNITEDELVLFNYSRISFRSHLLEAMHDQIIFYRSKLNFFVKFHNETSIHDINAIKLWRESNVSIYSGDNYVATIDNCDVVYTDTTALNSNMLLAECCCCKFSIDTDEFSKLTTLLSGNYQVCKVYRSFPGSRTYVMVGYKPEVSRAIENLGLHIHCMKEYASVRETVYHLVVYLAKIIKEHGYTQLVLDAIRSYQSVIFLHAIEAYRRWNIPVPPMSLIDPHKLPVTICLEVSHSDRSPGSLRYEQDLFLIKRNIDFVVDYRSSKDNRNISRLLKRTLPYVIGTVPTLGRVRHFSQAFCKMIEILTCIHAYIVKDNVDHIEAIHTCEAPGQFIVACLWFFCQVNITYNWHASSAKPDNHASYFGDDYGLIKKFPNQWKWADIRDWSYIKTLNHSYNLYTCDVGLETDTFGHQESQLKKIQLSSFIAGLMALKLNGILILKLFLPSSSAELQWILETAAANFHRTIFIKPSVNPGSSEYYLIGYKLLKLFSISELESVDLNLKITSRLAIPLTVLTRHNIIWISRNIVIARQNLRTDGSVLQQQFAQLWTKRFIAHKLK